MAANPPISNFHTNGSLDVQTRINRFLSTIEPHTRFFTAQGRTYLDSLIERDKKEDRALKADKTGWATVGLDPTSTLIDVAQAGEDATESGKSATGMSSVSQRGGLRARMRDRYGNTSAMITAVRSVKLAKTKVNSKETPVNVLNTSSSSPIKAWRDIRPKSSVQATSTSKVLLEPVVEIPVYSTNIGHVERDDIQHSPTETLEKATSKKRKLLDGDSISMADVDVGTSRKEGDSWSDAKPAPAAKKSKAHATDEAENHRRPLGESSARLNSAKNRGSRKETKVDLSQINLRSKALIKTATRQQLSEKAEDQAREEILTARRDKRRKRMALKTVHAPTSKKGKRKPESTSYSSAVSMEEDDPVQSRRSRKVKEHQDLKVKRSRADPSAALLKAYEVHGHLDPRQRITLPTSKLRLGLFGKGMISGLTGKLKRPFQHPPDLQFHTENVIETKRKITSTIIASETAESSSAGNHTLSPVKVRKAPKLDKIEKTDVPKRIRKRQAAVESKQRGGISIKSPNSESSVFSAEERSGRKNSDPKRTQERQLSPDWPTISMEEGEPELTKQAVDQESDRFHLKKRASPMQPQVKDPSPLVGANSNTSIEHISNPNHASSSGGGRDLPPFHQPGTNTAPDGPSSLGRRDGSCSPSLDTRSYADMLVEALACPSSSESNASVKRDQGSQFIFDSNDPSMGLPNMRCPSRTDDMENHVARAIPPIPEGNPDQVWRELTVGTCYDHCCNAFYVDHARGDLDRPETLQHIEYLAEEEAPVIAAKVNNPASEDPSLALSSMPFDASGNDQTETRRFDDAEILDIFGTEVERARVLLYGRN